ncbi:MAG: hypothetical protein HRT35_35860, partial [Algicola sp.]|nr:hypothetical protein [Algicola sp.]
GNLIRDDRVETLTIDDPVTVGEVVVGERFYTDFQGRILLPASYVEHTGKTFKFILRANDYGINITDTPPINLTIKADTVKPQIIVQQPLNTVVERQSLIIDVDIKDNMSVDRFKIFMADQPNIILAEKTGVNEKHIQVNSAYLGDDFELDLSVYSPIPAAGKVVTLVVEAADLAGNIATTSHNITIMPDQIPAISLSGLTSQWLKGGAGYHTFDISDDFVGAEDLVKFVPVYSSLSTQTQTGQDRGLTNNITPTNEYSSEASLYAQLAYPESAGFSGSVLLNNRPYLQVADGQLKLFAAPEGGIQSILKVDFGADITTHYQVQTYSDSECCTLGKKQTITEADGLALAQFFANETTVVIVDFSFTHNGGGAVPQFIQQLRIEVNSQNDISQYTLDNSNRPIDVASLKLAMTVADNGLGSALNGQGKALLMAGTQQSYSDFDTGTKLVAASGQLLALMSQPWFNQVAIYGLTADRLSFERGPLALTPLLNQRLDDDILPPSVDIMAPLADTVVVPGQRVELDFWIEDNSTTIDTLALMFNGTLVAEVGGAYGKNQYKLQFDLPKSLYGGSEAEFTLVATDKSGNSLSDTVTLAVDSNEAPTLVITAFNADRLITSAERLALAEFWVRSGGNFTLTSELSDDAALSSVTLYRLTREGDKIVEYQQNFDKVCPVLPIKRKEVAITIQFNETEPTEYELAIVDNTANTVKRTIIVNPLANVTPGIRITVPSDNQYIVAGTFNLKVAAVAADDRALEADKVTFYVDGIEVNAVTEEQGSNIGGESVVEQAYQSIYDEFERKYGVNVAEDYATVLSPNKLEKVWILNIPASLIVANNPVVITARVEDEDNAVGTDEITIIGAVDEINPEVAVLNPAAGFGAIESSQMTIQYGGY